MVLGESTTDRLAQRSGNSWNRQYKKETAMIKGIHHISLKCGTKEEAEKVRKFYTEVLGLKICREWGGGLMIDTGNGLIEVFTDGEGEKRLGAVRHVALLTDNVDETAARVKAAGYEVFKEPADKVIPSDPPYPIRMAFCRGPLNEEIEFFFER